MKPEIKSWKLLWEHDPLSLWLYVLSTSVIVFGGLLNYTGSTHTAASYKKFLGPR